MNHAENDKSQMPIMTGIAALLAWALSVLGLLLMGGCASRAVVVEPIAPKVAHLQSTVRATTTAAKRVQASVTTLNATTTDLRAALAKGMIEADRVRKSGLADQTFLDSNAERWREADVKIGLLEAMTKSATIDSNELSATATAASSEAGELVTTASTLDAGVVKMKVEAAKQAPDAALGAEVKKTGWIILVLLIFAIIVYAVIKIAPYVIAATSKTIIP